MKMKKLFLIFLFIFNPIVTFANINGCKTDVYFANGILTEKKDTIYYTDLLEKSIKKNLYANNKEEMSKHIGKVRYMYNSTNYFGLHDLGETLRQKLDLNTFYDFIGDVHGRDLATQITAYNTSVEAGNKVLVVAHSQGNLFTYEAYNKVATDTKKNFEAVSVASPMSEDIKYGTTRIDWDNDIVPRIATVGKHMPWMTPNDTRYVNWESNNYFGTGKPSSDYVVKSEIDKTYTKSGYSYSAKEAGIDLNSYVHAFTFYMGETLKDSEGKEEILNGFTGATLQDPSAKTKIMNAISTKLDSLCKCSNADNSPQPKSGIITISLD
jgi:hypothetical protein